jgi:hypothetical protein
VGGRGSGGRRTGSGRKRLSDLERAIGGDAGKRAGVVLQHPNSTAVAAVVTFGPPAYLTVPPTLRRLRAVLKRAKRQQAELSAIAAAQEKLDEVVAQTHEVLAVWRELAPQAFEARTLTKATVSAFAMLCRAVAVERASEIPDADHRGLMQRVATWMKDFGLAPLGKPMYAAAPAAVENPLDRFTKARA